MGYESKLYVVHKSSLEPNEKGYTWAEMIASFNLCRVCNNLMTNIVDKGKKTDVYFYDGNKEIYEDKYGEPLTEFSINEMIEMIENAMQYTDYRRYYPCLAMLRSFYDNQKQWGEGLIVLHYGY